MADITAEQLEELPLACAKTHVAELRAVHIHQALPGAPATVETEAGHFRLSKRLSLVATKAFAVGASDSAAPRRGRLGTILSVMAGMELTPRPRTPRRSPTSSRTRSRRSRATWPRRPRRGSRA